MQTTFATNIIIIETNQTACGCRAQIDAVEIIGRLPGIDSNEKRCLLSGSIHVKVDSNLMSHANRLRANVNLLLGKALKSKVNFQKYALKLLKF